MMNVLPTEEVALLSCIDPDAYTANTYTGDWVKADQFDQFLGVFMVGTQTGSSTVICTIQQGNTSSGGSSKVVTGKTATTLTSDSDKQVLINVRSEECDQANTFLWIAPQMVVGVAASDACAFLLGFGPRYLPSDTDLASVDELVN